MVRATPWADYQHCKQYGSKTDAISAVCRVAVDVLVDEPGAVTFSHAVAKPRPASLAKSG